MQGQGTEMRRRGTESVESGELSETKKGLVVQDKIRRKGDRFGMIFVVVVGLLIFLMFFFFFFRC